MAEDNYECTYSKSNEKDLVTERNCLSYSEGVRNQVTGGDALISKKVCATAFYDENGLGHLYSSVGVFSFTKSGLVRKTLNYDNGPDYFENGMARTEWKQKIGFFDKKLSIVIEPKYEFAFPFKNGLSRVCIGCSQRRVGEHIEIVGGKWGAINVKGEIVQPIVYSKSELETRLE